ncbi:hypothetical protein ACFE04_007549 [Oxalis oulophora]
MIKELASITITRALLTVSHWLLSFQVLHKHNHLLLWKNNYRQCWSRENNVFPDHFRLDISITSPKTDHLPTDVIFTIADVLNRLSVPTTSTCTYPLQVYSIHESLDTGNSDLGSNSALASSLEYLGSTCVQGRVYVFSLLAYKGKICPSHLHQIHAQVYRLYAHQDNLIATRLIGHYSPNLSLKVFDQLIYPNIFPFNAIIRVLAESSTSSTNNAFLIFNKLKHMSLNPNDFTFSFLLKFCFRASTDLFVKQIHTHVVKSGFCYDSAISNALLAVYAKKVRDLVSAHKLFDEMPDRSNVCSWTSLLAGYAQSGRSDDVLRLFCMMVRNDLRPQDDTMVSILSSCSNLRVEEIEHWVIVLSEIEHCVDSVNTLLIHLYGKWGKIEKSREIFDKISNSGKKSSILPWNTMLCAYAQNGYHLEALSLFRSMVNDSNNRRPNHVTMVSVLSACAHVGDIDLGMWIHEFMKSIGPKYIIQSNTLLATAFINMYSKCGNLERAKLVFDQIISKDIVSFNAMIMGLATNGRAEEAFIYFSEMIELGLYPNDGSFLGVLCACSHSGSVMRGQQIFQDMSLKYSVSPKLEHYACYIDLLARVGHIEQALEVVETIMPYEPNNYVWGALLSGCLLHGKLDLAQKVSKRLVKLDPENSGGYVMLANSYALDHRWGDVSSLRWSMKENGVRKQPGCSWISIGGIVHEFLVGSSSHPHIEIMYDTLEGLMKEMKVVDVRDDGNIVFFF